MNVKYLDLTPYCPPVHGDDLLRRRLEHRLLWQYPGKLEWNVQVQITPVFPKLIKGTLFH